MSIMVEKNIGITLSYTSRKEFEENKVTDVAIVSAKVWRAKKNNQLFFKLTCKDATDGRLMETFSRVETEQEQYEVFEGIFRQLQIIAVEDDPIEMINNNAGKTIKVKFEAYEYTPNAEVVALLSDSKKAVKKEPEKKIGHKFVYDPVRF